MPPNGLDTEDNLIGDNRNLKNDENNEDGEKKGEEATVEERILTLTK